MGGRGKKGDEGVWVGGRCKRCLRDNKTSKKFTGGWLLKSNIVSVPIPL